MKFLTFKKLSWKMSLSLYLISHKNFFNKKDYFGFKNCPLLWRALCALSHKSIWRGLTLLEEAVTVDGGKMSADYFGVLLEQKKFLTLIVLAAVAGAFKNCSILHRWNLSTRHFPFKKIFSFYPFFFFFFNVFLILRFRWFELQFIGFSCSVHDISRDDSWR